MCKQKQKHSDCVSWRGVEKEDKGVNTNRGWGGGVKTKTILPTPTSLGFSESPKNKSPPNATYGSRLLAGDGTRRTLGIELS